MGGRTGRRAWWLGALALTALLSAAAAAWLTFADSRSRERMVERAAREGELRIYSTTDVYEVAPLLDAFRRRYPSIDVRYAEIGSVELYRRFQSETQAGGRSADILWSSAMDLQIKLVNDGYAQAYESPERPALPEWAVWKNEAYGITAEPVVFVYNRRLLPERDVPGSHREFARLLTDHPEMFRGKVAAPDPVRGAAGYLLLTQDIQTNRDSWRIVRALGATDASLHVTSRDMIEQVASGEALIAYNVLGSYALEYAARDPNLGVVVPSDYSLVISRIAVIPDNARHVNAARLFLDFMLSREGQSLLSSRFMTPVRHDVAAPKGPVAAEATTRAIRVGPALLVYLDQLKRRNVLKTWQETFEGAHAP